MKEINQNIIEEALATYAETVSPSKDTFKAILSQIPVEKKQEEGRAIRSPYMWLEITQFVTLFSIMIVTIPTILQSINDPFYQIDKQVELFEHQIEEEDLNNALTEPDL